MSRICAWCMRQAVILPAVLKADVSLILRNPKAMDSARNQVMFALNDYLAGLALDQLSNQASVGGISFSTNANNGLMVNANGYTQRLPQLFQALLEGYFSYTATEDQLEQAKSWYNQMMDSAEKGKAFEQAIMPAQMLSQVPYFSRDERRKILPSITLKEVLAYRDALKSEPTRVYGYRQHDRGPGNNAGTRCAKTVGR